MNSTAAEDTPITENDKVISTLPNPFRDKLDIVNMLCGSIPLGCHIGGVQRKLCRLSKNKQL